MKTKLLVVLSLAGLAALFAQGPLTPPPGAPAPTMKTLDQVEPRTAVSSPNFFITASGSYYLTKDITGLGGLHGIVIQADNVTLDLSGFALTGTGAGTHGIFVSSGGKNLTVRNGTLRNWGGRGLRAGSAVNSHFESLRVSNNGAEGIEAGTSCAITGCRVDSSGTTGILAGAGASVSDCTVTNNAVGITVGDNSRLKDCIADGGTSAITFAIGCGQGCAVTGCTARNNGYTGISGGVHGMVQNCTARGNTGIGIVVSQGCVKDSIGENNSLSGINATEGSTIVNCLVRGNAQTGINVTNGQGTLIDRCSATLNKGDGIFLNAGGTVENCTASQNDGDGIQVSGNCVVSANHCYANGPLTADGAGIHATGSGNRIDGNDVGSNDRGLDVDNDRNLIIRNSAFANGANYSQIVANNSVGEIVDLSMAGGTLNETHGPWANISY